MDTAHSLNGASLPWWRRLRPEEYIFLAFAGAICLLLQFGTSGRYGWDDLWNQVVWRVGHYVRSQWEWLPFPPILLVGCAASALGAACWIRPRIAGLVRDAAPFLLAYLAYVLLRDLIPYIRPDLVDGQLAAMETSLLGTPSYVAIPRALRNPALDVVLMGCYLTHYYIPPIVAIILALRKRERFRRMMLGLTIAWAVGYLGYIAVPAVGPKYFFSNYELWRVNGAISPAVAIIDEYARLTRDCFPSMHVAWTVLTLWALRPYRLAFGVYCAVAAGLTLATLYFGFHYLIDLPAGALLAVGSIWAARRLSDWWYTSRG